MSVRKRVLGRIERTMTYWGLLEHPFGIEYVRDHYSPTGKKIKATEETVVEIPTVGPSESDA
ncbi:hypothetical protein Htur_1221 [Haloterrigena turkmenica DSM 5511]|uniref:Uncharacterized protein n=1 Tax=Haloterrigena turkmenica (strain ATCC 51198 / DSM 5511 / JCM 9101 / NCIMB 13204 / VKM B-1734 / 4k) TaxID=543526 RepID=D2RP78_HALTV|nr:hypothetical protein [Haloterrigena turkmenica]ADB60112.1 hypothetical protein Htur_1221 [Haloterrigena turkmenica DSM 5511]